MNTIQSFKEKAKDFISRHSNNRFAAGVACTIGAIIILSLAFQAGVHVGYRKASFGRDWNNHYEHNFGPGPRGPMKEPGDRFPNPHGTIGKIIRSSSPTFVVVGNDSLEKVVVTDANTKILKMREPGTVADLAVDTYIAVIGTPNSEGQIVAKLIRILPNPNEL